MMDGPLRVTQTPILGGLAANPDGLTMAGLSDSLEMDRTTLLRNIGPLRRKGYLTSEAEGKRTRLKITKEGLSALEKSFAQWHVAQARVMKTLGAERWKNLLKDLEIATEALAA